MREIGNSLNLLCKLGEKPLVLTPSGNSIMPTYTVCHLFLSAVMSRFNSRIGGCQSSRGTLKFASSSWMWMRATPILREKTRSLQLNGRCFTPYLYVGGEMAVGICMASVSRYGESRILTRVSEPSNGFNINSAHRPLVDSGQPENSSYPPF